MTAAGQLLVMQEHDTRIDQLRHRRATLPPRAALAELEAALEALAGERAGVQAGRDDLGTRQARLEGDLDALERRAVELDKKLAQGSVPRELQALALERDGVLERHGHLEDELLEVLEAVEAADAALVRLDDQRVELQRQVVAGRDELAVAEAEIDAELGAELGARERAAADVPDALQAEYERLRAKLGGVAAAPLTRSSCGGCHLTLSAVALDRIRGLPPDAIVHCEQCGRILVRSR
ncbi:MAG: hypothetical protein IPM45_16595 [Acidimicrobiales bacterium]|nr:hypothetical protein [Acidimicrobiales bacterium]